MGETPPSQPGLDDFAEFLASTYAPLINALALRGVNAEVVRGGTGHYLLMATSDGAQVEVTDHGKPLPASYADVAGWLVTVGGRSQVVAPGAPEDVAAGILAALADTDR